MRNQVKIVQQDCENLCTTTQLCKTVSRPPYPMPARDAHAVNATLARSSDEPGEQTSRSEANATEPRIIFHRVAISAAAAARLHKFRSTNSPAARRLSDNALA
ncbi:hypothetical protein EVAR_67400_1 [Eumeta japonica]|uniref:Uncharacterized protein n=1 Tax=Eumeta variegata TaxID=151549 RepID=A0A4C2A076_EUMVA|nr:hypothetical protein EVAR_67400_1 [Eumeta japonica]